MRTDRLGRIFNAAASAGIVIPAFNTPYPEMVEPVIRALKSLDTFGLVEVSRIEFEKFGAISATTIANEYFKYADSDVTSLHLDHIPVIDEDGNRVDWEPYMKEAISAGYDSVMLDGSRLSFEENVQEVSKVAKLAHEKGVFVEAELGAVLGHESGPLPPYDEIFANKMGFTNPDQAREFVEKTGVDWLSVSVGSIHGAISGATFNKAKVAAKLDIEHLKKLRSVTGVPLVLHGGSGVQQSYVDEAVKNGLVKINIGTDIRRAYCDTLDSGASIAEAQDAVVKSIDEIVSRQYRVQGSASRLRRLIA